MGGTTYQNNTLKPAIALAGRVPVKVTDENGIIKSGDYITTSSLKGAGMKATSPGAVVGIALESFDGSNGENCGSFKCSKILAFVNIGERNIASALEQLSKENIELKRRIDLLEAKIK